MSDEELLDALRNSKGWPTLGNAAADRIEELTATIEELSNCVAVLEVELAEIEAERERKTAKQAQALEAAIATLAKLKGETDA
jgi:uncharacterized small protein (DUF1192 family)